MAKLDTDTLSWREAARLATDLDKTVRELPIHLFCETFADLPPADIDVLRGIIRIVKQRGADANRQYVTI